MDKKICLLYMSLAANNVNCMGKTMAAIPECSNAQTHGEITSVVRIIIHLSNLPYSSFQVACQNAKCQVQSPLTLTNH